MAKRKKLLLVDDQSKTVESIKNLIELKCNDWQIFTAYDGAEALSIAAKEKPDLILLDIDMPIMDGFTVLDKIRERGIATRVVMLSGYYTSRDHVIRCIKGGACDHLDKPFDVDDFLVRTRIWMETENTINVNIKTRLNYVEGLFDQIEQQSREISDLKQKLAVASGDQPPRHVAFVRAGLAFAVIAIFTALAFKEGALAVAAVFGIVAVFACFVIPWERVIRFAFKGAGTETAIEMKDKDNSKLAGPG